MRSSSPPTRAELFSALRSPKRYEDDLHAKCMHAHVAERLFGARGEVTIAGARFAVRRRLGAGAMGVVYEVECVGRSGSLALKLLYRAGGDEAYRLKREFRTLSRLGHPNLVVLHELFADAEGAAFTMELVRGVDFLAFVCPDGALDAARLRHVLAQLAEGLWYLHSEGIVHRDLKPQNVVVTGAGRAVLLDFGVAFTGPERDVSGTARFMAPEQARGESVPASDLYALGVMLELALAGTPHAGALASLHALAADLTQHEPSVRPSPLALLRALGDAPRTAVARPRAPRFVGRTAELEALTAIVTAPRTAPQLVYLEGHAGQGKSALIAELVRRLGHASPRPLVLAGRCCRRETVRYRALDPLIDALCDALAGDERALVESSVEAVYAPLVSLFPAFGRVPALARLRASARVLADPRERRAAAVVALRRLLARIAEARTLVMCVDDVHWLDDESLALMRELFGASDAPRATWICAGRPEASGRFDALAGAVPPRDSHRIVLAPLAEPDALALARALLPAHEHLWARATALSAGNPLLLSQLGPLSVSTAGEGLALEGVVERRLEGLPALGRALLGVVALASTPLSLAQLGEAACVSRAELECALNLLGAQRYVRETTTEPLRIEPYHDRIAEWIGDSLTASVRTDVHRRIADALARDASVAEAQALLFHYRRAGEHEKALVHGARAAEDAREQLRFHEAAALFAECIELAPTKSARDDFAAARASVLVSAGRDREAAELLSSLAEQSAAPSQRFSLACRAAELFFQAGYTGEAMRQLAPFIRGLGLRPHRTALGMLLSIAYHRARLRVPLSLYALSGKIDMAEAERRVELCLLLTRGLGRTQALQGFDYASRLAVHVRRGATDDQHVRALLLGALLACNVTPTGPRADALLDEARARSAGVDDPVLRARVLMAASQCASMRIERPRMRAYAEEAIALFERHGRGVQMELGEARWLTLLAKFGTGASIVEELEAVLADALRRGDRVTEANARMCLANGRLASGRVRDARREVDAALTLVGPHKREVIRWVGMSTHARVDLYEGAPERAGARLTRALSTIALQGVSWVPWLRVELRYLLALSALATHGAGARRKVRRLAARIDAERLDFPRALARQLSAALLIVDGRTVAAARELLAVADVLESQGGAWYASGSRWLAHRLLGQTDALAALGDELRRRGTPEPERFLTCYAPFVRSVAHE